MTEQSEQRNAEIWSTRVQRELLALTTDNAPEHDTSENKGILPPFITVKEHQLDIAAGTCIVSFLVGLPIAHKKAAAEGEDTPGSPSDKASGEALESSTDDNNTPGTVTVTLDASLAKKHDGSLDTAAPAYPFLQPRAVIASGSEKFPSGSTIRDGDPVVIDCDWTPSLHLSDAVLNIGLKIKESILQKEPFHPATEMQQQQDPIDEMMSNARAIGDRLGKGLRGLGFKATGSKDEGDNSSRQSRKKKKQPKTRSTVPGEVRIGDEINLLEPPWVDAQGVYTCKAVRRPEFVEAAIQHAALENKPTEPSESGVGNMFRNFTRSAKGVLEESFFMITETHIIEMKSSKLNLSMGTVTFAIPIELMAKLKFRRQESISLFFKSAPNDPLIYMCPDSADAVHQIQAVLKRHGVKGKHTNAAAHRAIGEALQLVQEIQTKELALRHDPTVERVNEIMDLYRQAAERFEVAGDVRHEEVVTHMRKFLALPVTMSILDGSYKKVESPGKTLNTGGSSEVPEGEVLERNDALVKGEEEDASKEKDKAFEANMDDILEEAKKDMANFHLDDDDHSHDDDEIPTETASAEELVDDAFADLDAMLSEADKELAELMGS